MFHHQNSQPSAMRRGFEPILKLEGPVDRARSPLRPQNQRTPSPLLVQSALHALPQASF